MMLKSVTEMLCLLRILKLKVRFFTIALCVPFILACTTDDSIRNTPDPDPDDYEPATPNTDFTIVVMPDTQHYTSNLAGGDNDMFTSQINWIVENKEDKNIVYVLGVGDITQYGDRKPEDWVRAKNGYYTLEEHDIPYGLAVGNHDQWPQDYPVSGTTEEYNKWFGVDHFSDKPYYGGHYGDDNDTNYNLISAGGQDFIIIFIEYDKTDEDWEGMNSWTADLLDTYASRKAIIVTHYLMKPGEQGAFSPQGKAIYEQVKDKSNVFMMLGGHLSGPGPGDGEGYREDTYNSHTVRSYLIDYQGYDKVGKGGYLRYMQFTIDANDILHQTYSPYLDYSEKDADSFFTKPLFGAPPAAVLSDGNYKIQAKGMDKVATVSDQSLENNARIVPAEYTDDEMENDEWTLEKMGDSGWYKIVNANSGKALAVESSSTDWGSQVIQYTYSDNNIDNDEWGFYEVGDGYYKVINRRTGLCLKATGASNGNHYVQSGYQLLDEEKFHIVPVP